MNQLLMEVPPSHPAAEALRLAAEELTMGAAAIADGNEGRARVCGRRAVAVFVLARSAPAGTGYGTHALSILRGISSDPGLPDEIRAAATRLLGGARSIAQGEPFSTHPLADAAQIINYFVAVTV
jgi:hypothetical protein